MAFRHLPKTHTIHIKYEDVLFNLQSVIDKLLLHFPLKNEYLDINTFNFQLYNILNTPSKSSGQPRFGIIAKNYYDDSNLNSLYKPATFRWLKHELKHDLMKKLGYNLI